MKLSDATSLRLDGVLAPTALDGLVTTGSWPPERKALRALEDLVQGKTVGVAVVRRSRDRYGRLGGHLFVGQHQGARSRWVQAELVARGAVRVDVTALEPGCANLLLALEDNARRNRTGLWMHAAYRVRDASRPRLLLRYRSTYQIVEGRVHKIARVRKRIFINFDRDWRSDFTVGLTTRIAQRLGLSSKQIARLEGRRVQVRGWIERRGGPFIFLRSRSQIRSLDAPASGHRQRSGPLAGWPSGTAPGPTALDRSRQPPDGAPPKQFRPAVSGPGGIDL